MNKKEILDLFKVEFIDEILNYLKELEIRSHAYNQNYRANIQSAIRNLKRAYVQYKRNFVIQKLEKFKLLDTEV